MKSGNDFLSDMLDWDNAASFEEALFQAAEAEDIEVENGHVVLKVKFKSVKTNKDKNSERSSKIRKIFLRSYGKNIIRLTLTKDQKLPDDHDNVMLKFHPDLKQTSLNFDKEKNKWNIRDEKGRSKTFIDLREPTIKKWSDFIGPPEKNLKMTLVPDGQNKIPITSNDTFTPDQIESVGMGFTAKDNDIQKTVFSLKSEVNEKYAGTGERFSSLNLSDKTFNLENTDALGNNSNRAYKNVPFYISSRNYGIFLNTSSHLRLSFKDISKRSVQGIVEDDTLDIFFIADETPERILYHYRCLTGFPPEVPLWSYGTWMSRMTYFNAEETLEKADKLREKEIPCDVIHIDTGWFKTDWKCEWEFSPERFPEPEKYLEEMKQKGFRVTLWQNPMILEETKHYDHALEKGYIKKNHNSKVSGSDFELLDFSKIIDFTNPDAVEWYKGLLKNLLKKGVAAIKADFGEIIDTSINYQNMSAEKLHNLYSLLYQKAVFEATKEIYGKPVIWARAGWAGCQRYPVHWAGDTSSTFDGMVCCLKGGLHIGLSGFGYWSHDVPGFHGLPDFMNSWPCDELYVRWTQFGVFSSHLRYHGTSPREPYEYPEIEDIARNWFKLRYCLIPYILKQAQKVTASGYPLLRAMIFHHYEDAVCWHIDDQYYFGDSFLVGPVMNSEGIRNIYLPEGNWIDIWTAERFEGPVWLKRRKYSLSRMPIFVKAGDEIEIYPYAVQSTDDMDLSKTISIKFDETFKGLENSALGDIIEL